MAAPIKHVMTSPISSDEIRTYMTMRELVSWHDHFERAPLTEDVLVKSSKVTDCRSTPNVLKQEFQYLEELECISLPQNWLNSLTLFLNNPWEITNDYEKIMLEYFRTCGERSGQ